MSIRKRPKVLVDSSVLIAAILSSRGGSFYILTQLVNRYEFLINEYILQEVFRVLNRKYPNDLDKRFVLFELMATARVAVWSNPTPQVVARWSRIVRDSADAPILATATRTSGYLLTLDDDFFAPSVIVAAQKANLKIHKPRDFIQTMRGSS